MTDAMSDPARLEPSDAESPQPFVSVVMPVRDGARRVGATLEALLAQTYPRERYEIIVVDNDSSDGTRETVRTYPVTLLEERTVRSPYAARNVGIGKARGAIIAMLDVNTVPRPDWLEQAIATLQSEEADLVGGRVRFLLSERPSLAEMFDSISNVKMESSIRARGVAKGGNLIVRKRVLDAIGPFPAHLRSGGDVLWTGQATRAGFRLVYASTAEVVYPARGLAPLLRKQFRVGRGQPDIWRDGGDRWLKRAARTILGFRPPARTTIRRQLEERGTPEMLRRFTRIWLVAWCCSLATNFGRIATVLGLPGVRKPKVRERPQ